MSAATLSWAGIVRLGLVQSALGAIVVLTTSTLNRVMVVELALPAMLPGALVAWHYAVQMCRPRMGHGTDSGRRATPWIVGGMLVLAASGWLAAIATAWMTTARGPGIALAIVAFTGIGLGVGAAGTSLLVLLAKRVAPQRRGAAATIVWIMMIAGFAVTAGVAGKLLDPYSPARLVAVSGAVSVFAFLVALVALYRVEPRGSVQLAAAGEASTARPRVPFRVALAEAWADPDARHFTIFVFVSMLAYSAQDLILEPFSGSVYSYTPGQSTQLSGLQHGGVLVGMILVALATSFRRGGPLGSLRAWTIGGCVASALAMCALALAALNGPPWPLASIVFVLGVANGGFSIAAIASMMSLAGAQREREGVRMGLWGAAQAIAFGVGGFAGTAASDIARALISSPGAAYAAVFAMEMVLFVLAARLAWSIGLRNRSAAIASVAIGGATGAVTASAD